MPVYLNYTHNFEKLAQFKSVLIVPCRFCPAASFAVRKKEPYFEFFRHMLQTDSYERYIDTMKSELEKKGVKVDVFRSRLPHQFVVCMWTSMRRKKLMKRAEKYDALVVLGCEAAVQTIRDSSDVPSFQVIQGMETEGIMSILPRYQFPANITLQLNSVTPMLHQGTDPEQWVHL